MNRPFLRAPFVGALILGAAMGMFVGASSAHAQDVAAGLRSFKSANCAQCHGWAGDGKGELNSPAPSLRATKLDRAAIIETIRCGRPGMPHHDRSAYTNSAATSCYGMVGRGPVTLEECTSYWGAGNPNCAQAGR